MDAGVEKSVDLLEVDRVLAVSSGTRVRMARSNTPALGSVSHESGQRFKILRSSRNG
jgi:hypothetical protein